MNKVKIVICGRKYILNTPEDEKYLLDLSKVLSRNISQLKTKEPSISLIDACILVGLDTLSDKQKLKTNCDNLREQITKYSQETRKVEFELENAKNEIAVLKHKLKTLAKKQKSSI